MTRTALYRHYDAEGAPVLRITLHGCDVARFEGVEQKARGMAGPIGPLARKLINQGEANPFDWVEVWRGETLCFHKRALIHWASVHTSEGVNSTVRTSVYKARPDFEAAQ